MKRIITAALVTLVSIYGYSQTYLPLTAGSANPLTGDLYFNSNTKFIAFGSNSSINPYIQGGINNELYFGTGNNWGIKMDALRNVSLSGSLTGTAATFSGTLLKNSTGNGTTASAFFDDFIDYRFSSTGGNSTKIQFGNAFTSNNSTLMRFVVNGIGGGSDPISAQTIRYNNIDFSLPISGTSATFSGTLLKNSTGNGTIASPFFDDFIDYRFSSTGGNSTKIQFGNAFTSNNSTLMRFVVNGIGGGSDLINAQTIRYNNIDFSLPITGTSATFTNQVAIGTSQADAHLYVHGLIKSKEVKVEATVSVPDYVFEKSYDLKSLPEVEKYITENKHLPEIPSARVIEKDGINIGEMQLGLLKKIEELTLHLIEQNKRLERQDKENAELKLRMKQLEEKVK